MLKELEEDVDKVKNMMCEKNGNVSDTENLKGNQKEVMQLKSTITDEKFIQIFKGRFEMVGKRISELQDRTMEIINADEQKEQRLKISEQSNRTCETPSAGAKYTSWESQKERKGHRESLKKSIEIYKNI